MGKLKNFFGGSEKGSQCVRNPDGTQTCSIYSVEGNQKVATGTAVTIGVDSSSCEPMLMGDINAINESDSEEVKKVMDSMRSGCKKGLT